MAASWEHADVFPVIARLIEDRFAVKGDFVTHDEISASLVSDSEGATIISQALESGESHTPAWVAHNMVAWFRLANQTGRSDLIGSSSTTSGPTNLKSMHPERRCNWATWPPSLSCGQVGSLPLIPRGIHTLSLRQVGGHLGIWRPTWPS